MAEKYGCLELNVPDLFADPAFAAWLNASAGNGTATWHHPGDSPGELSDVFIVYDHGESGDSSEAPGGMPGHCWDRLRALAEQDGFEYGVLRLTNLDDESDRA